MSKKLFALLLGLIMACTVAAGAEAAEMLEVEDYLADQASIDAMLVAEGAAGYGFEAPLVVVNPYGNAPLSAVAIFSTDEAVGGTITVKGKAAEDDIVGSFEAALVHYVPIYGLYAGQKTQVELALDDGRTTALEVETDAVNLGLDGFSAQMQDAALYDYGELTLCGYITQRCYAGYDSKGELRWALTDTGANAITRLDNGHFLIPNRYGHGAEFPNGLTGIREIDPMGKVYNAYVWNGGEHHEIIVLPNGHYMVTGSCPGYVPTNRDYVFEIDPATGEVVWQMSLAELVAPGSSGCENDNGADWCHDNALAYDAATDTLLISCRHICAVVAVEKEARRLKWILGDPAGWSEEYAPYLLKAEGDDFAWAYGQHQLTLLDNGDLLMFDNGTFGRVKQIDADRALSDDQNYSRAVIYRIDEDAGSVSQVWEYGRSLGAACYASSMSGIQCLDEAKQRFLVTFGTCVGEDDSVKTYIQLIEGGALVWQMEYQGASTYRGYRGALYGTGAWAPGEAGAWHGDMGETARLEAAQADVDGAEALSVDIKVSLYPVDALRFYGAFNVADAEALNNAAVVLRAEDGALYAYDLGFIRAKTQDGIRAVPSRWVSLKGLPAGEYRIYIVLDGATYDAGRSVAVAE